MSKTIKRIAALLVFAGVSCLTQTTWAYNTYYAQLVTKVSTKGSGFGKVYAGTSTTAGEYSDTTSSSDTQSSDTSGTELTFYAFAQATDIGVFDGWSKSDGDSVDSGTDSPHTQTIAATSTSESSPTTQTLYAIFSKKNPVLTADASSLLSAHLVLKKVAVKTEEKTPSGSSYTVANKDDVTLTFAAAENYVLTSGETLTLSNVRYDATINSSTANLPTTKGAAKYVTVDAASLATKNLIVESVTMNGAAVSASGSTYEVEYGSTVVVTFKPTEHHVLTGGATLDLGTISGDVTLNAATANLPATDLETIYISADATLADTAHLAIASVKNDTTGEAIAVSGGQYALKYGQSATVTFAAVSGYVITSGSATLSLGALYANCVITSSTPNLPTTAAAVYLTVDAAKLAGKGLVVVKVVNEATGATIVGSGDQYACLSGDKLLVTFEAIESGHKATGNNPMTITMDGNKTIDDTTANLPSIEPGSKLANELTYEYGGLSAIIGYEGATVTTNGNDLIFTFRDTKNLGKMEFMKPELYSVEILAVGGGGAGGTQSKKANGAGGGGGGGYQDVLSSSFTAGMYYIAVGAGGQKADSSLTSVYGMNGGNSVVTNAEGSVIASAVGGGGGGASLGDGSTGGQSGGSGGGGAWVAGKATSGGYGAGGTGRDGQGHNGGTPSKQFDGAGGGGAGGEGGALGQAGDGLVNDISGEDVEYARGGAGGLESSIAAAVDGQGPGWGGQGGNGGIGGAGGDGIVIVRVSAMYKNVQIQRPSVLNGGLDTHGPKVLDEDGNEPMSEFVYTEGDPETWFVSPIYTAKVVDKDGNYILKPGSKTDYLTYDDVTNYVQGIWTTNAWTTVEGGSNVVHGIGHRQFTMHLKTGYSWVDDSDPDYGSSEGALVEWRITTDLDITDATISVKKTVVWDDASNATITVSAYATPKQNPVTPKVLFIGTLCGAHSLESSTIIDSINTIAKNADIDWYVCSVDNVSAKTAGSYKNGSLTKGNVLSQTDEDTIVSIFKSSSAHFAIHGFTDRIVNLVDEAHSTYQYIALEFDGSRIACTKGTSSGNSSTVEPWQDANEAELAKRMMWYYENDRVIWITDHCNAEKKGLTEPFGGTEYYRPNTFYAYSSDSSSDSLNFTAYRGLVALLDPKNYFDEDGNAKTSFEDIMTESKKLSNTTYYANDRNSLQEYYDSVENLTNFLSKTIVPVAYDLTYSDQVKANVGLSIKSVEFFVTTNNIEITEPETHPESGDWSGWWRIGNWDAETGEVDFDAGYNKWCDLTPKNFGEINIDVTMVNTSSNIVTLSMENMLCETRGKIVIHIVDDGTFKTTADATWNPVTQEWEKDPNNGKAHVSMSVDGEETSVEGSAATSAAWSFKTYWIDAEVTNGEIFLNGLRTNELGFAEGYNPKVAYRGLPGYVINTLFVDANPWEIVGDLTNYVSFTALASDHSVAVTYTNYLRSITATPVTNVYDGAGHVFKVEPLFIPGVNYETEIRYSMTGAENTYTNEAAFLETNKETLKNRGDHAFYYKVYALQPGYGSELNESGWVEIGRELIGEGKCTSTITPKTVTVTPVSVKCATGDDAPPFTASYVGIIDGETVESALVTNSIQFTCAYKKGDPAGQYAIDVVPGSVWNKTYENYAIKCVTDYLNVGKSPFIINDVSQGPSLDPNDPYIDTGVPYVEKIYDGDPTGLVINVTFPSDPTNYKILYSTNGVDWTEEPPTFTDACTSNKVWYALENASSGDYCFATTNYQYVTVKPRPVTLRSASAEKQYDGDPLETNEVLVVSKLGFVEREKAGITMTTVTRLTYVATINNNYEVTFDETVAKRSNYDITYEYGTLTMTLAQIIIGPNDPEHPEKNVIYPVDTDRGLRPEPGSNGVENVTNVYNGAGNRITVNVIKPLSDYTIKYSGDGVTWASDYAVTNVHGGKGVYFVVEHNRGYYAPVTNIAYITVIPKDASVTAGGVTNVYNGKPLTCAAFSQAGFVAGEGIAAATMTAASTITNVGEQPNVIATLEPMAGTLLSNYAIVTNAGLLKVTKKGLTIATPDKSANYKDQASITFTASEVTATGYESGETFTYQNFAVQSGKGSRAATCDIVPATALLENYAITTNWGTLTLGEANVYVGGQEYPNDPKDWPKADPDPAKNESGVNPVIKYYDGNPTSVTVKVTYPQANPNTKVTYSLDNVNWSETKPTFTREIGTNKVYFAVGISDNYNYITNTAYVIILPRPVTVVADDQAITYGETLPELEGAFTVSNAVIAADVFTAPLAYTNASGQAGFYREGIVTNAAISVANAGADVTACYDIAFEAGDLTIKQAKPSVTVEPAVKEYDGNGTNITVTADEGLDIYYSTDGGKTWLTELQLTNVVLKAGKPDSYLVTYKVHDPKGNYEDVISATNVTISPRHVTIKVNSFSMYINDVRAGKDKEKYSAILTYDNSEVMRDEDAKLISYKIGATGDMVVGHNTLTATYETYQGNYVLSHVDGDLEIFNSKTIAYEVAGATNCYDAVGYKISVNVTDPTSGTTVKYGLGENGPWYDYASAPAVTNASQDGGTPIYYQITCTDTAYFSPVVSYAVLVVTQRLVTVTATNACKYAGAKDPELGATISGVSKNETARPSELITYTVTRDEGEDVGEYTIRAKGAASQGNYAVAYSNATFTILKDPVKPIVFAWPDDITTNYDGEGHMYKVVVTDPAGDAANVTYALAEEGPYAKNLQITNACGKTKVYFKISAADYITTNGFAYVTINKTRLTVTANDKSVVYGATEQPTYDYTITGFVKSETASVVSGQATFGCPTFADCVKTVGPHAGVITYESDDLQAENYSFTFAAGNLTVTEKAIRFDAPTVSETYSGEGVEPVITYDPTLEEPRIEYLVDGVWTQTKPCFTNVVETNVTFKIYAKGCTPVTSNLTLKVTKRDIAFTSEDQNWKYDGLTHYGKTPLVGGMGYANERETFDFVTTNITDIGECKALFEIVENGTALKSNYNITCNYGTLSVSANAGQIAVVSGTDTWAYDGKPHGKGCTTNGVELLDAGDKLVVDWDGVTLTEPGTAKNTFSAKIVNAEGEDVTKSYTQFVAVTGTLTVVNASFTDADFKTIPYSGTYDGKGTNIVVELVKTEGIDKGTVSFAYSLDGETWGANPVFTDVVSTSVWFAATAEHHNAYTSAVPVAIAILPRPVTFASPNGSCTFAEAQIKALATDVANITTNEGSMAEGEYFRFVSATNLSVVGGCDALFDVDFAASNAKEGNYAIAKTYGRLTVVADGGITLVATNRVFTYNGSAQWDHGYAIAGLPSKVTVKSVTFDAKSVITYPSEGKVANKITGVELEGDAAQLADIATTNFIDGTLTMENATLPQAVVTSTNTVYDGKNYQIGVTVPGMPGVKITYSETGSDNSFIYDAPPAYRDAKDYDVWYKIEANGYDTVIGWTNLTIALREVTLSSLSVTNYYDGAGLSTTNRGSAAVIVTSATKLAEGDAFDAAATYTTTVITNAGASGNSYVYKVVNPGYAGKDLTGNYSFKTDYGTVCVKPAEVALTITVNDKPYDGKTDATYKTSVFAAEKGAIPEGEALKLLDEKMAFYFTDASVGTHTVTNDVFSPDFVVTNAANMVRDNYSVVKVSVNSAAILSIDPPSIDPEDPENPHYPESGPFPGPNLPPEQKLPPAETNGVPVVLSTYDVAVCYDGEGHTFNTNDLYRAILTNDTRYAKNFTGVQYSLTGTNENTWVDAPFQFTNVVATSFWYRVSANNYTSYVHAVGVTVTQRVSTITFAAANKAYDGNTNATCTVTNFANRVKGDAFTLNTADMHFYFADANVGEHVVTAVGYSDALVSPVGDTLKGNYSFDFIATTNARITSRAITFVVTPTNEYAWAKGVSQFPDNLVVKDDLGKTLKKDSDYTVDAFTAIDVTNATANVTGIGNYAGSSGSVPFWITAYDTIYVTDDVTNATVRIGAVSGNEVWAVCEPAEGYCVDAQNSVTNGIVRKVDHTDGLLKLLVKYEKDGNGDGVPDRYQRKITFRVVNGWWDESDAGSGSAAKSVIITKYKNNDGVTWDENGSGILTGAPSVGNHPYGSGFTTGGKWWPAIPTNNVTVVNNATPPLFLYGYNRTGGGASQRVSGAAIAPDFSASANITTFSYTDGKVLFKVNEVAYESGTLVVSMPLEATQVTVEGTESLSEPIAWRDLATKATDLDGYVTIDAGTCRFFRITVK